MVAAWMLLTATVAAGAGAPLADPGAVLRLLRDQDAAVLRVGERLAVGGAGICGNAGWSAGMTVEQLDQFGEPFRAAARVNFGIDDRPTVAVVVPGGAAAAAGIRPGDVILAIDGHRFAVAAAKSAEGRFAGIATAHDAIETALSDGRAELEILRDGRPLTIAMVARRACRARFDVRAGRSNNASSDGTYVQVSSDLVAQARGDGELAAIMAHELAHNILEHPRLLHATGARPSVRSTEVAADRLSVYLLDAAGYSPADALSFWAHWGRANDLGILSDRTHPGWKKRIVTIQAEAAAIAAQKAAGGPIRVPADLQPPR